MTTHRIEIRRPGHGPASDNWTPLTRMPMPERDALDLVARLGPAWEVRIRPELAPGMITDETLLERLSALIEIDPEVMAQVKRGTHVGEAVLRPLRQFLFGAFERLGDSPEVFQRWRTSDHQLNHLSTCRGGKAEWSTQGSVTVGGGAWLLLREMERRARHLNEYTIPGLGIVARARVLPPKAHDGVCNACKVHVHAMSVVLEIAYGSHDLRREYLL